jgi:hypothetical protein
LSANDAGWLAKYINAKILKEKENAGEVVEKELAVRPIIVFILLSTN